MDQVFLKDVRDFETFNFSEHESNCLKTAIRSDLKIGYVSVSKELFFADPLTLVFVSEETNKNPLYGIINSKL